MKKIKFTGLNASGQTHPKIRIGDIFRDKYGDSVVINSVYERHITYRRAGFDYDCVMPVHQFRRDFSLVCAAPRSKPTSKEKARANIQVIKNMINAFRGKK